MSKYSQHGFITVNSAQSVVIEITEGWTQIDVENDDDSSGNVTIQGSVLRTIGGNKCATRVVKPGQSFTFGDSETVIGGVTITVPAGTTCYISAYSKEDITNT